MSFLKQSPDENKNFLFASSTTRSTNSLMQSQFIPPEIPCDAISADDDPMELWNKFTMEVLAFKTRFKRPETLSQCKHFAVMMNSICRPYNMPQFDADDLLEKCLELDKNEGWDKIYPLNEEPIVNNPPRFQTVTNALPAVKIDEKLHQSRTARSNWIYQQQQKWERFWSHENNLNELKKGLCETAPTSSFFERIVDRINRNCEFPKGFTAKTMTSDEVQRKTFEIVKMTANLSELILSDDPSLTQSHYAGVVGREKEKKMCEHENKHGECEWLEFAECSDKEESFRQEIVNIAFLNSLEKSGIIKKRLNNSAGAD